mmetsp:Transcript_57833/g.129013  ORF Transcript_57833/g.129013 Transcript_57833/m.129013 type:complete len:268 (-) Transcript_57833:83-886(-)
MLHDTRLVCPASLPGSGYHPPTSMRQTLMRQYKVCKRGHLQGENVFGERRHHLARVLRDEASLEEGDRAGDGCLGQEAEQANHSKAAVVELNQPAPGLRLLGFCFHVSERVEQVEGRRVRHHVKSGEVSRLPARHVMLLAIACEHGLVLPQRLHDADEEDDLPLGDLRQGIPHRRRRQAGRDSLCNGITLRADVVLMHNVANKAKHRNAAVLDFRLAQEADGRLVGGAPELLVGELKWIPVANHGVELLSEGDEVGLRLHGHAAAAS